MPPPRLNPQPPRSDRETHGIKVGLHQKSSDGCQYPYPSSPPNPTNVDPNQGKRVSRTTSSKILGSAQEAVITTIINTNDGEDES